MIIGRENGPSDSSLAHWMTHCVLSAYRETFGTLDPLRREFGVTLSRALTLLETSHVDVGASAPSPAELRKLCANALSQIWVQTNRARGRMPTRPGDWRVILYSLSSARTVREAIHRCIDCFEAIDGRCGRMRLRVREGEAELEIDPLSESPSIVYCLMGLIGADEFHDLLEWLIAQPLPMSRICLNYRIDIFDKFGLPPLSFPVEFDAGWTGFTFPASYLDFPVARIAETILERSPHSFLFETEDSRPSPDAAYQVRHIAMRALRNDHQFPSFEEVAAAAGLSPATLRRRLMKQETNYRQIKESCRRELVLRLLRQSDLSIEEIAARLDYCDSDTFRRAFRTWTGTSPSKLREQTVSATTI
jgi:AraC-like DNA-binding protein